MTSITNPLAGILSWFEGLDPECQGDIAAFVFLSESTDFDFATLIPAFRDWLDEDGLHPLVALGRAGRIRTVVSVCFTRPRSRPEFWADGASSNLIISAKARADGNEQLADMLSSNVGKSHDRQLRWRQTIASWESLIEGAISDTSLEHWFETAMQQRP